MQPESQLLSELVRRIVETAHPLRILLFGSAARAEMGPTSDLDVLVVVPDGTHEGKTTEQIYRGLWGMGCSKDVVVVTEADIQKHGDNPNMILKTALAEGKELYHVSP
ncbi:MAG: nucleotidyltransferase domain-containing protein [Armatimonadetes bacterium]|nr:nucleotidyltransferase domain-containing protein [Armatimonadota bacterium]